MKNISFTTNNGIESSENNKHIAKTDDFNPSTTSHPTRDYCDNSEEYVYDAIHFTDNNTYIRDPLLSHLEDMVRRIDSFYW